MERMNRSRVNLMVATVCAMGLAGSARGDIHWLSGPSPTVSRSPEQVESAIASLARRPNDRHVVVRFSGPAGVDRRDALARAGVTLLSYVGDHAYFATLSNQNVDASAAVRLGLVEALAIETAWTLHPKYLRGEVPTHALVSGSVAEGTATVAAYVLLHRDVTLAEGADLVARHGGLIRDELRTVNGLVIELPLASVRALAAEDGVQWIEPPLPPMTGNNDSNRAVTQANIVQQAPYDLDGSGVTVLVFDAGFADDSHPDFGGRLTVRDESGLSAHATHVSGTIGGSGSQSGGQFRGMAPGVTIESYGFEWNGGGIFLYSNPGDIERDYDEAINVYGADIANNSIGTNTSQNGFDCDITGDYGVTASVIDSIVRGGLGSPFRVVWANGNERGVSRCGTSYYSTAPPAGAKNHITVGALNSNDDSMTGFSSWGPTDDGRLKPDISAPGCQRGGDGAVTSTVPGGGYSGFCGTSMASPTVAGLSALILQDFRAHYPDLPDPRNSMLKVFHAHTAEDRGNVGPDYQFGYGSVRVQRAIDFLRADDFYEDWTTQDHVSDFMIRIEPGDTELKVTIAWDDVPATPNIDIALINDADIIVTDPNGVRHFPWTLSPANPGAPAVQTQEDHLNNIEQVYVANPMEGVWRVQVVGFNVPEGPQVIAIGGSPRISRDCDFNNIPDEEQIEEDPDIDCAGNGIIDECEPDCDDDGVADTCVLFRGEDDDCNENRVPDGCEPDCNENNVADDCDIRDGFSEDCNDNAVPDECDVVNGNSEDCNENGLPDECDIAERRSLDFNNNGIPDECEPPQTVHVDDDAPGDPGPGDPEESDPDEDGSPEHPFDAIQEAIDHSLTGDTVLVADGTYSGVGNRLLNFRGRPITVRSAGGAEVCTIDLLGVGPAFFFRDGEPASAVVEGFTITGGVAPNGGAMYFHSSGPTVRNCVIRGNRASGAGGGLFCSTNSFPTIINCVIDGNTSTRQGGGVYATTGVDVLISDSIITRNVATGRGGGVYARRGEVAIRNVTFSGNRSSTAGGGIFTDLDADVTVTSSILWDNAAPVGNELAIADPESRLTVSFSDVEGGESGVDVASGTLVWGEGNIDSDPGFYDAGGGDYHIRPDSICVDAGDPSRPSNDDTDIDGDARVFNDRVDIGGDEFGCSILGDHARFFACITGPGGAFGSACECADMDDDGDVDLSDWTIFQVLFPGE